MIYVLNGVTLTLIVMALEPPAPVIRTDYYRLSLNVGTFAIEFDNDGNLNARNENLMIDNFATDLEKLLEDVLSRVTGNLKNALQKQANLPQQIIPALELNIMDNKYLTYFTKVNESFIPMFISWPSNATEYSGIATADVPKNNTFNKEFISEDATQYPDVTHEDVLPDVNYLIQQALIKSNLTILRSVITQIERAIE